MLPLDELIRTVGGEWRREIRADGLTPEEVVQGQPLRQQLYAAIGSLPPKYQRVLVLRDLEGLSLKQVGSLMGLGERAAKFRLHRARRFVVQRFEQDKQLLPEETQ